jgi:hypothetical protein
VIPASRTREQLRENLAAGDEGIDEDSAARLLALWEQEFSQAPLNW